MSVELLRKSLHFIEEEDGLAMDNKKRKKAQRISASVRERQRIRALAARIEFDCEEGDFIGDRNSKRRKCIDDGITTKAGVSLVEQHRAEKRVDLLKRNIKYMVYTNEKKLDSNRVGSIIAMMNQRDSEKKEALRQLLKQNDGVREPNPFKPKKETCESIFTDEDFMNVGPQRVKVEEREIAFLESVVAREEEESNLERSFSKSQESTYTNNEIKASAAKAE